MVYLCSTSCELQRAVVVQTRYKKMDLGSLVTDQ